MPFPKLLYVQPALGWVTVFEHLNHLGLQLAIQANSASYPTRDGKWVPAKVWWIVMLCG